MLRRSIPLQRPWFPARASEYLADVMSRRRLGSGGQYGSWCESFLEETTGCARALMVSSASSGLDAACLLIDLVPGDEVILPSFAFPSAASAVVKCGATPVFVDIEPEHLTIDCDAVEAAISPRTKAVVAVDYAGWACDYDRLARIAGRHGLAIIEDAAHAFDARFRGRALGTFGTFGVYSFQQTKNISCGEGGALLVNDPAFVARAEHFRDKGTNRQEMERGLVPFYEWVEIGAGIGLNELSAAILRSQFEQAAVIKETRRRLFNAYVERLVRLEECSVIRLIRPADEGEHNAHFFAFLAGSRSDRQRILAHLNEQGIGAAFHYIPLHRSVAGRAYGRCGQLGCPVAEDAADRIVRLPLFHELSEQEIEFICAEIVAVLGAVPQT